MCSRSAGSSFFSVQQWAHPSASVGCLVLLIVLLPLVPLFEMYDDIRRAYEDR